MRLWARSVRPGVTGLDRAFAAESTMSTPARTGSRRGGAAGGERRGVARRGAFTLVELMVVVSILALLVAILLPVFGRVFEVARDARCKNNLEKIAQALHASSNQNIGVGSTGGSLQIPTRAAWYNKVLAVTNNSAELLYCLSDERDAADLGQIELALDTILKDVYVLQFHTGSTSSYDCSFITDLMAGRPVSDPQVWAIYPAGNRYDAPKGEHWPAELIPDVQDNQIWIGIDNDAAVLFTFADTYIEIRPMDSTSHQYSRHWIMKGKGTPVHPLPGGVEPEDEDDTMLCHLWGWHVQSLDSPVIISNTPPSSYGINSLLEQKRWDPAELYIMDANEVVVDVLKSELDDVRDRHYKRNRNGEIVGKVNTVTVDGSVRTYTLEELQKEFLKFEDGEPSLWRKD